MAALVGNPKPTSQRFAERALPAPRLSSAPSAQGADRHDSPRFFERPPLGLPIQESEEYRGPFNPYGLAGPEDHSSEGSEPTSSVQRFLRRPSGGPIESAILDLTARMERMERRAEEAEAHCFRLQAKIDKAVTSQERMEAKLDDDDEVGYCNTRDIRDLGHRVQSKCSLLAA